MTEHMREIIRNQVMQIYIYALFYLKIVDKKTAKGEPKTKSKDSKAKPNVDPKVKAVTKRTTNDSFLISGGLAEAYIRGLV